MNEQEDNAGNYSPRVNSALLAKYVGRTVRLTCKVLKLQGATALVQASDGGQVTVKLLREAPITDTYVDIVGKVIDENSMSLLQVSNWGSSFDMDVVNATVLKLDELKEWLGPSKPGF